MASGYPVMLHLHDRQVAVVGGGPVAARKVRQLRKAGARIFVDQPHMPQTNYKNWLGRATSCGGAKATSATASKAICPCWSSPRPTIRA